MILWEESWQLYILSDRIHTKSSLVYSQHLKKFGNEAILPQQAKAG